MNGKKVLMAMSGGVDSSAAAVLLQRQGYRVDGAMLNLLPEGNDTADARAVAERLGMDFLLLEGSGDFAAEVMDRFVSEYCAGRTPNPCIDCNRCLKFGLFLDRALELGYDYIATGHYARVEKAEGGKFRLLRGLDRKKDQSYMLYQLTQQQLSHLLLPVGEYDKPAIREFAREAGLENADKSDSQDICFIPDGDYARFLREYGGVEMIPGDFVDGEGRVLPQLGWFDRSFEFPAIREDGRVWMTVTPNEINTILPAVHESRGKVLTYGLGLGYYAFHCLLKDEVESVTVVERNPAVIDMFRKHLLPFFPRREALHIVQADAFDYAANVMSGEGFDTVFTDLWHDVADGLPLYHRMKALEVPGPRYLYWIEKTLKCYME